MEEKADINESYTTYYTLLVYPQFTVWKQNKQTNKNSTIGTFTLKIQKFYTKYFFLLWQ